MPLSEQEQRLLDEMERNLYQNDADFVSTVGSRSSRPSYRAIVLGSLLALAGIIALLIGVGTRLPVVGVIGFVVMFAGVLLAVTPARSSRRPGAKGKARRPSPKKPEASGSFMAQLNDRWDRRQDNRE
jgi:Flp pilus assembly protein TadB